MNTSGINNLQNQYALYSGTTSNTTNTTSTTSTSSQSSDSSTADTVTLSPEALALQTAETDTVNRSNSESFGVGQGVGVRPPQ